MASGEFWADANMGSGIPGPSGFLMSMSGNPCADMPVGYYLNRHDMEVARGWQDRVVKPISKYDPLGDEVSSIEYVQHAGDDRMIVNAARVSYANDMDFNAPITDKDYKLIRYLFKHKHGTPFEHNLITFRIKAPLYVIQEMLRHRVGTSFNQQSHRYVQPGQTDDEPFRKYYVPTHFRYQHESNKQSSSGEFSEVDYLRAKAEYVESCDRSFDSYERLIEMGVAREQARGTLPHCTYSSLYMTVNIRSLLNFLVLRLDETAQWEIRQYGKSMVKLVEPYFPYTFKALKELEILNESK